MQLQALWPIARDVAESLVVPGDPRRVELRPGGEASVQVVVDEAKLRQAVTNVLSNAFKYSPGRGPTRVSLPTRIDRRRNEVDVRVEDEGIGMSPQQLSRVFERFYRAQPADPVPGTRVTLWMPRAPEADDGPGGQPPAGDAPA